MNFQENCPERYWQKGFRQPRDNGVPEFMWGDYYPGDEPGWMCSIEGGGCVDSPVNCPLWEKRHEGIYENDGVFYNDFTGEFWEKE